MPAAATAASARDRQGGGRGVKRFTAGRRNRRAAQRPIAGEGGGRRVNRLSLREKNVSNFAKKLLIINLFSV